MTKYAHNFHLVFLHKLVWAGAFFSVSSYSLSTLSLFLRLSFLFPNSYLLYLNFQHNIRVCMTDQFRIHTFLLLFLINKLIFCTRMSGIVHIFVPIKPLFDLHL